MRVSFFVINGSIDSTWMDEGVLNLVLLNFSRNLLCNGNSSNPLTFLSKNIVLLTMFDKLDLVNDRDETRNAVENMLEKSILFRLPT